MARVARLRAARRASSVGARAIVCATARSRSARISAATATAIAPGSLLRMRARRVRRSGTSMRASCAAREAAREEALLELVALRRRADEAEVAPVVARRAPRRRARGRAHDCACDHDDAGAARRVARAPPPGASVATTSTLAGTSRGKVGVARVDPAHACRQRAEHLHERAADVAVAEHEHVESRGTTVWTSSVDAIAVGEATSAPRPCAATRGRAARPPRNRARASPSEPAASSAVTTMCAAVVAGADARHERHGARRALAARPRRRATRVASRDDRERERGHAAAALPQPRGQRKAHEPRRRRGVDCASASRASRIASNSRWPPPMVPNASSAADDHRGPRLARRRAASRARR